VCDGTLDRVDFQVMVAPSATIKVRPIRARVQELLRKGTTLAHAKTRHTCENILKLEVALW